MVGVFGDRERLSSIVDLVFEQMLPILHTSTEEACETCCSVVQIANFSSSIHLLLKK